MEREVELLRIRRRNLLQGLGNRGPSPAAVLANDRQQLPHPRQQAPDRNQRRRGLPLAADLVGCLWCPVALGAGDEVEDLGR